MHPERGQGAGEVAAAAGTTAVLAAVAVYLVAVRRLRRRGDAWPRRREVSFTAAGAALVTAVAVPLPGEAFTVHMTRHLLAGMAAPLLLVLARPLTLALRALRPGPTRRALLAAAHRPVPRRLVFPPVAAVLDMGGLWLLYRTPLLAAAHDRPVLHAAVHAHVVLAGVLFAAAICQLDPVRRRWGLPLRATTLLLGGTAHAVLAKTLYATGPPGTAFTADDLQVAARMMYYGGDLAELALATVLAVQWYRAAGRRRTPRTRRVSTGRRGYLHES
ncbi:MAG TPA: cytochrome c oxidase assembly protein [Spirillospora sp.]